jgi:hypothetical protein
MKMKTKDQRQKTKDKRPKIKDPSWEIEAKRKPVALCVGEGVG